MQCVWTVSWLALNCRAQTIRRSKHAVSVNLSYYNGISSIATLLASCIFIQNRTILFVCLWLDLLMYNSTVIFFMLLFNNDTLQVTVKTFIMFQMTPTLNWLKAFLFHFYSKNLETVYKGFYKNIKLFSTLIMKNVSLESNQHIKLISELWCDSEDWHNGCWKFSNAITTINTTFNY